MYISTEAGGAINIHDTDTSSRRRLEGCAYAPLC